jgi:hypothetical protein
MDKIFKLITDLVPFLAPYPAWVKGLLCFWVFVSAALLGSLLLARPSEAQKDATKEPPQEGQIYLTIKGVRSYNELRELNSLVRVTAYVNGAPYVYPSISDIKWLVVSPDMAPQRFLLPPAKEGYEVRFEAEGMIDGNPFQARSTKVDAIKSNSFGKDQEYNLYPFDGSTGSRGGTISHRVSYVIQME